MTDGSIFMRALRILLIAIGLLAGYKALQVLVMGQPLDPRTALTEWAAQARSERPVGLGPATTLTKIDVRWEESNSVWSGDPLKDWTETFELREKTGEHAGGPDEKDLILVHLCGSPLRQKVLRLGVPITARMIGPGKYDYRELVLTKASCIGKGLKR